MDSNLCKVCRRFDHAVRWSGELQYIVELGVGGLADGPPQHPFNTFERLNYLKSRRLEWRDPHVEEIAAIPPLAQAHLWKLRAGTLVRVFNRNPLLQGYFDIVGVTRLNPSSAEQSECTHTLASQHTGFEFDPGQDLLVLFNRFPSLPWYVFPLKEDSMSLNTPQFICFLHIAIAQRRDAPPGSGKSSPRSSVPWKVHKPPNRQSCVCRMGRNSCCTTV